MLNITLSPKIIKRLKKLDQSILDLYAQITHFNRETLDQIHRYARVSNLGASTRIENALLTDSEINWLDTILSTDGKQNAFEKNKILIENKLSKDRERSIEEVSGCRAMLLLIYERHREFLPLRESDLRGLHDVLMRPYLKKSPLIGNYKIQPNSVVEINHQTKESRVVFKTADAGVITSMAMQELLTWYNTAMNQKNWSIAVVSEFVYRFLAIHPFQDGNGRMGRGLFILGLLQSHHRALAAVAPYLAIDRQIEKHKEEYYFVLNACSQGQYASNPATYKMEYFLIFMIKMIEEALLDIPIYYKKFEKFKKLSVSALNVLNCFKENPEIKLNTGTICEITELPRRTVIYALNQLLDSQFIQKYGQGPGTRYQITF